MQQIANILEQPISLQTSRRRKIRKRPCSLVLFIPLGAGAAPACTRKKINQKYLHIFEFSDAIFAGDLCTYIYIYIYV